MRPDLSARQVKQLLMDTAGRTTALRGRTASGFVHAHRAVTTTPKAQIAGRIVTPQGAGVAGVLVADSVSGRSVSTNANGEYVLGELAYGANYSLTFSKASYTLNPATSSGRITTDVVRNGVATFIAYRLAGRVAVNGTPLAGVTIYDPVLGSRTTDAQGYFSYEGIGTGRGYAITVSKVGYRMEPATAIGTLTSDLELSFNAIPAPYRFGAQFTLSGKALAKVRVTGTIGGVAYSGLSAKNGWIIIENIPAGTAVNLTFYYPGYVLSTSTYTATITETTSLGRITASKPRRR